LHDIGYWAIHGAGARANRLLLSVFGYEDVYDDALETFQLYAGDAGTVDVDEDYEEEVDDEYG